MLVQIVAWFCTLLIICIRNIPCIYYTFRVYNACICVCHLGSWDISRDSWPVSFLHEESIHQTKSSSVTITPEWATTVIITTNIDYCSVPTRAAATIRQYCYQLVINSLHTLYNQFHLFIELDHKKFSVHCILMLSLFHSHNKLICLAIMITIKVREFYHVKLSSFIWTMH